MLGELTMNLRENRIVEKAPTHRISGRVVSFLCSSEREQTLERFEAAKREISSWNVGITVFWQISFSMGKK